VIHIITATNPEAKFFINYLKLKKINSIKEFQIYFNEKFSLTISGIGKINSAISVTTTYHELGKIKNNCWINIGIAGHSSSIIGELFIINKIIDNTSLKNYYPYSPNITKINELSCTTYDKVDSKYSNSLSDMELSGFYQAANKYSYRELIHSLKIVSDNRQNPFNYEEKDKIEKLFEAKKKYFDIFFQKVLKIWSENITDQSEMNLKIESLLSKIKTTKSEYEQIKKLLKLIYLKKKSIKNDLFDSKTGAKKILSTLKKIIHL